MKKPKSTKTSKSNPAISGKTKKSGSKKKHSSIKDAQLKTRLLERPTPNHDVTVSVKMSAVQREEIRAAAAEVKLSLSGFIRDVTLAALVPST